MRKAWRRPACDEDCDWRKGRVQKHQRCFGAMTQDLQGPWTSSRVRCSWVTQFLQVHPESGQSFHPVAERKATRNIPPSHRTPCCSSQQELRSYPMALSPIRATGDWSERFDDNPSSRIGCNILSHPQQAHSERPQVDFSTFHRQPIRVNRCKPRG
jgi:hypothetical protein